MTLVKPSKASKKNLTDKLKKLKPSVYEYSDGASYTFVYPGSDEKPLYHTLRYGKTLDGETMEIVGHIMAVTTTINDPRDPGFKEHTNDTIAVIPLTDAAVYGIISLLLTVRADMNPDTAPMVQSVFQQGHFNKH